MDVLPISGLEGGADAVREVVEKAAYMVLGLGDVYLGAPCAVPVDPRCALCKAAEPRDLRDIHINADGY